MNQISRLIVCTKLDMINELLIIGYFQNIYIVFSISSIIIIIEYKILIIGIWKSCAEQFENTEIELIHSQTANRKYIFIQYMYIVHIKCFVK